MEVRDWLVVSRRNRGFILQTELCKQIKLITCYKIILLHPPDILCCQSLYRENPKYISKIYVGQIIMAAALTALANFWCIIRISEVLGRIFIIRILFKGVK